ncbi:T9SS type A sorting domain-containing protein [Mesonia ostreae]|uniref:T9SS type A sorting domain-containing protein n=1 Tax=Mesonia ostreae TaxID=861110 RepID=A0ABU2KJM6_9FLAO|nr:T9SS type A sorting domain-containing protein [Mesonia ostreae]MDT0294910.1 T9SS type A sorting domain-containing protein [Mesonia ostreae]
MKLNLLFLSVLLCMVSSLQAQHFPGGVTGAEVWYKTTHEDLDNNIFIDYSGNEVRISDCNSFNSDLFNFNPSIRAEKLCLFYNDRLENVNAHNLFVVSEPIDNKKSFRHFSTVFNNSVPDNFIYLGNQVNLNDSIARNAYFLETQQGFASQLFSKFNQHQNTHVHFYSWSNYDQDKKFKSFGRKGETLHYIGRYIPFEEVENGLQFNGLLPEFVSYDRMLTDNERNRIESYLGLKYGITLNRTRDYKNSKNKIFWDKVNNELFKNNIFGLGRDDISGLNQLQAESAHRRDYLVAGVTQILETNQKLQERVRIENNNFIVFGDTGKKDISSPNELGLRLMKKVWLAQTTGRKAWEEFPIKFKLFLNEEFQPYLQDIKAGKLVVWMLHDKFTDNSYVSDFDNGNIEYYKPVDLDFLSNGKAYAHFNKETFFDPDRSFFDQFTFAVGPEIIIQVRYKKWQCKDKCFDIEIIVKGGSPDYSVELIDEVGNPIQVEFSHIENDEFIYNAKVCGPQKYSVGVDDSNGATSSYSFLVEERNYTLDLGSDQSLNAQQTEVTIDAGQGIDDPDATYQWFYNGVQIYHSESILVVDEIGEYCVIVTTSDMSCQLEDCIRIYHQLKGTMKPVSSCNQEENYLEIFIDEGSPNFETHVVGNGLDYYQTNSSNQFIIPNVPSGSYTVTVTDAAGASFTETINFSGTGFNLGSLGSDQTLSETQPQITLDGTLPFGNDPNFSYQWYRNDELLSNTNSEFTVGVPGEYKVIVIDPSRDCDGVATINIDHDFKGSINYLNDCGESSNTIEILIDYGIPVYYISIIGTQANGDSYVLEESYTGNITLSDFPYGEYTITVTDDYGGSLEQAIEFIGLQLNIHEQLQNLSGQCVSGYDEDFCEDVDVPYIHPAYTCNSFDLDASTLINSGQNVSYEWFITEISLDITSPEITFEPGGECYSSNNPDFDSDYSCQSLPVYKVVITDNETGCSISQSFAIRGWCPVREMNKNAPTPAPNLLTKVYPNPTQQGAIFYYDVSSEENFNGVVELHDMNGKQIRQININGQSSYTLPFSMLSAGVYLITVKTNGKLTTDRIIIE